jgi:tRNA(fMet)-specific endonuclease VapC
MLYMLDTDICSYIIRQRPPEVLATMQYKVQDGHEICISVITYAELRLGAQRSQHSGKYHPLIDGFCERLHVVKPWDSQAADKFVAIQAALLNQGTPIGNNDAMIAGHAISIGAILVTNNHKHFNQVTGLTHENWCT